MAMIVDLGIKKLEHWFSDAHFNFNNQSWEFPNGDELALRDVVDIIEFLASKGAKGRYQIVRDDDGFLLFPMNGDGEVLRYPEEPEKKNFSIPDKKWKEGWINVPDIQPWAPQPATNPWIVWTDGATSGNTNDFETWKINSSGLPVRVSGGINDAAT